MSHPKRVILAVMDDPDFSLRNQRHRDYWANQILLALVKSGHMAPEIDVRASGGQLTTTPNKKDGK